MPQEKRTTKEKTVKNSSQEEKDVDKKKKKTREQQAAENYHNARYAFEKVKFFLKRFEKYEKFDEARKEIDFYMQKAEKQMNLIIKYKDNITCKAFKEYMGKVIELMKAFEQDKGQIKNEKQSGSDTQPGSEA